MTEPRESQHSLLSEANLVTVRPQRAWNPLGGRSSPDSAFVSLQSSTQETFSEDVLREVGLGITSSSGETLPAQEDRKRRSVSTASGLFTPGFAKTPETPAPSHYRGNCPSRSSVLQRRLSWIPATILILAFYATFFSGIYLAVAVLRPRWSNIDSGPGSVTASTANLLCAFFAKTIELAYVTICVAFLGQVLSRRALMEDSRGISLADMSMRAWIMQPGSMIVHWETLRYSGLTFLGVIALTATVVGMFYTTAAEALGECCQCSSTT